MRTNGNSLLDEINIAADLCEHVGDAICAEFLRLLGELMSNRTSERFNRELAEMVIYRSSWDLVGRLDRKSVLRFFKVSKHREFLRERNFDKAALAIEAFQPRMQDFFGTPLFELLEEYVISLPQAMDTLSFSDQTNRRMESTLVSLGYASEEEVAIAVSKFNRMEFVDLSFAEIPQSVLQLCPESVCRENLVIPLRQYAGGVTFVASVPDEDLKAKISFILNRSVKFVLSTQSQIIDAINQSYGQDVADPLRDIHQYLNEIPDPSEFSQRSLSDVLQGRNLFRFLDLASLFGVSNSLFT